MRARALAEIALLLKQKRKKNIGREPKREVRTAPQNGTQHDFRWTLSFVCFDYGRFRVVAIKQTKHYIFARIHLRILIACVISKVLNLTRQRTVPSHSNNNNNDKMCIAKKNYNNGNNNLFE